jgi:predicted nucleic-acid-binding protein
VIAVDTNVLLRFSIGDNAEQGKVAKRFFEQLVESNETAFVASVTLAEFVWVLEKRYQVKSADMSRALTTLLNIPNLSFEHEAAIRHAISTDGGNFSDRLIHFVGAAAGCARTVTFDRKFARLSGVELLEPAQ